MHGNDKKSTHSDAYGGAMVSTGIKNSEQQVDEHEGCTAILAGDVRKAPDVAQTDGASGRDQDEAQSGTKLFSFFHCLLPLLRKSHRVALF